MQQSMKIGAITKYQTNMQLWSWYYNFKVWIVHLPAESGRIYDNMQAGIM